MPSIPRTILTWCGVGSSLMLPTTKVHAAARGPGLLQGKPFDEERSRLPGLRERAWRLDDTRPYRLLT